MKRPQVLRVAKRGRKKVLTDRRRRTFMGGRAGKWFGQLADGGEGGVQGGKRGKAPCLPPGSSGYANFAATVCKVPLPASGSSGLAADGAGSEAHGLLLRADSGAPERGGQGKEWPRAFLWLNRMRNRRRRRNRPAHVRQGRSMGGQPDTGKKEPGFSAGLGDGTEDVIIRPSALRCRSFQRRPPVR